jgi:hypothetical protein
MGTGTFTVQQMNAANTSASNYEANSAPSGFINSIKMTVATANTSPAAGAYCRILQPVEGLNIADLNWGTSSAKPVTLSFWVKSSLAGANYSACILNYNGNRVNPQQFTISAANTWQYVTLTYAGETTGSGLWYTNNNIGLFVDFWLAGGSSFNASGSGWNSSNGYEISGQSNWISSNGNTFYLTGVQLEAGTVATPFEWRHYSTELNLCYRYCQALKQGVGAWVNTTTCQLNIPYITPMRAAPVVSQTNTITVTDYIGNDYTQSATSISMLNGNDQYGTTVSMGNFTGVTSGRVAGIRNYTGTGVIIFSAEL